MRYTWSRASSWRKDCNGPIEVMRAHARISRRSRGLLVVAAAAPIGALVLPGRVDGGGREAAPSSPSSSAIGTRCAIGCAPGRRRSARRWHARLHGCGRADRAATSWVSGQEWRIYAGFGPHDDEVTISPVASGIARLSPPHTHGAGKDPRRGGWPHGPGRRQGLGVRAGGGPAARGGAGASGWHGAAPCPLWPAWAVATGARSCTVASVAHAP